MLSQPRAGTWTLGGAGKGAFNPKCLGSACLVLGWTGTHWLGRGLSGRGVLCRVSQPRSRQESLVRECLLLSADCGLSVPPAGAGGTNGSMAAVVSGRE